MKANIVDIAKKYLNQRELKNNSGFVDADLQKKMEAVGWSKGQAWCAYFGELIWKEAYKDDADTVALLDKLFSGSATATYKNFELHEVNGKRVFRCDMKPEPGALAIYRYGMSWQGHLGVVVSSVGNYTNNVEGNSNGEGGREGIESVMKNRPIKAHFKKNGLNLIGFVHPV
jgi:hypothetical protein